MPWAFVCALLETGRPKCWGQNGSGELGRNDAVFNAGPIGDEPSEMGDALPFVELF